MFVLPLDTVEYVSGTLLFSNGPLKPSFSLIFEDYMPA